MPRPKESGEDRVERETALQRHGVEPPTKESGMTPHQLAVEIAKMLRDESADVSWPDSEDDPDNFMLLQPNGSHLIVRVESW